MRKSNDLLENFFQKQRDFGYLESISLSRNLGDGRSSEYYVNIVLSEYPFYERNNKLLLTFSDVQKAPHTNSTPGHWSTIVKNAIKFAKDPNVEKVYVNKSISNEIPGSALNRPDIMVVMKDGTINQYEVPSKSDRIKELVSRIANNTKYLGNRAGRLSQVIPRQQLTSQTGRNGS